MVMGTSPASSEIQKKIRKIIQSCPSAIHIKDDIIVYGVGKGHDRSLEKVLSVLQDNGLTLRPDKCELGKPEIIWFGNVFSKYGMSPDPEKCAVVNQWSAPKSTAEVKSFLQTAQFNAKFLTGKPGEPSYPELTQPLRSLTKKYARFSWGDREEQAFQELKKRLCSDRVVVPFDTSLETRLYVDSSYAGTQATVAQEHIVDGRKCWRPVNHTSRPWTPAEARYSQIERESNGILTGMHMNRMYTVGTHVEVVTDHDPLLPIYTPNSTKQRPLRVDSHRTKLLAFDYHVIYQPGKETPCDYGSRHPPEMAQFSEKEKEEWCIESEDDIYVNRIIEDLLPHAIPLILMQKETQEDAELQQLKEDIISRKQCRKDLTSFRGIFHELSYMNGLILRGEKIVVPRSLQSDVIGLAHDCHLGSDKTVGLIRETCWFPKMTQMVREYVETCKGCLAAVSNTPPVPLQPNLLPDRPWQHLHGDFKGPIGSKYYLHVLIDQYSKFPEVDIVTSTKFDKLRPVLDRVFATHGVPETLSTDNGPPYFGDEMSQYAKQMGIKLTPVTPEDPQCNGFAENFVKTLCKLLHTCAAEDKDPKRELNRFLLQYRATPHLTTGRSPAEMLFNRRIRTKLPLHSSKCETDEKKEIRKVHDSKKLRQKEYFDKRRRAAEKKVKIGDQVLIKQKKTTTSPPYNPDPLTVTSVTGNQVTATNRNRKCKRDKNQIKVLRSRPEHLKPSWERRTATKVGATSDTTFDFSQFEPAANAIEAGHEQPETSQRESEVQLVSSPGHEADVEQPEFVRLDSDMTAHMEQLILRAEQNLGETGCTDRSRPTTRSAGRVLKWNTNMNSNDIIVEEDSVNETVE